MNGSTLASYTFASVATAVAVVVHAFYHQQYFYRACGYLYESKVAAMTLGNLMISLLLVFGKIIQVLFLGELRFREVDRLQIRTRDTVVESLIAISVFRTEIGAEFVVFMAALVFIKAFHWLAKDRVDFMEEQPLASVKAHVRLVALTLLLLVVDISSIYWCASVTLASSSAYKPILVLVIFEFTILLVGLLTNITRYLILLGDMATEGSWDGKGLFSFYNELSSDLCTLLVYMAFFVYVWTHHTLPLHIIRNIWVAFAKFQKRLNDFMRYRLVLKTMNDLFPDATEEELQNSDRVCIICRDEMDAAKKLECGHMFHPRCLQSWLKGQLTCPTCRAPITALSNLGRNNPNRNNNANQNINQNQIPGANGNEQHNHRVPNQPQAHPANPAHAHHAHHHPQNQPQPQSIVGAVRDAIIQRLGGQHRQYVIPARPNQPYYPQGFQQNRLVFDPRLGWREVAGPQNHAPGHNQRPQVRATHAIQVPPGFRVENTPTGIRLRRERRHGEERQPSQAQGPSHHHHHHHSNHGNHPPLHRQHQSHSQPQTQPPPQTQTQTQSQQTNRLHHHHHNNVPAHSGLSQIPRADTRASSQQVEGQNGNQPAPGSVPGENPGTSSTTSRPHTDRAQAHHAQPTLYYTGQQHYASAYPYPYVPVQGMTGRRAPAMMVQAGQQPPELSIARLVAIQDRLEAIHREVGSLIAEAANQRPDDPGVEVVTADEARIGEADSARGNTDDSTSTVQTSGAATTDNSPSTATDSDLRRRRLEFLEKSASASSAQPSKPAGNQPPESQT